MSLAADRPEFAPPPQRGTPRAVALALVAHVLLIAALTWGVHWKRDSENEAVEAELWSTTVQQAAPRLSAPTPPAPAPEPTPAPPPPPPPPPPAPQVRAPDPAPAPKAPDIALEREQKRIAQQERERELEAARQQKLKQEAAQKAAQDRKAQQLAQQRAEEEAERKEAQQKAQAEAQRREAAEAKQAAAADAARKKAAAEAKAVADAKKKEADAKQAAADRAATLKRMQGMAGADDQTSAPKLGKAGGTGGGTSSGYFGRVAALIKRNVVFDPESVSGNPEVEIQIQTSPDGTIVGTPRLVKSSGNPAWDEAALRAVQKTAVVPRDIDGRVPSPFPIIAVRPKN